MNLLHKYGHPGFRHWFPASIQAVLYEPRYMVLYLYYYKYIRSNWLKF